MSDFQKKRSREREKRKKMIVSIIVIWTLFALAAIAVWRFVVKPMLTNSLISVSSEFGQQNISGLQVGDTLTFGRYEQDNNDANGKEPIEWIILKKKGRSCLLISRYVLDCQQYQKYYTITTWESSELRKWLNKDFMSTAFSADEQKLICKTKVTADANPYFQTEVGNDTKDNIFCLSIVEANTYFSSDELRKSAPTDYAIAQETSAREGYYTTERRATEPWWLRTPGNFKITAAYVKYDGSIADNGTSVESLRFVRPALWINLG